MNFRILLAGFLAIFAFAAAHGATKPPISVATVTTVVERHKGGVGGLVVDQLGYVYIADFQENVWKLNPIGNELTLHASGLYGASGNVFDKNGNLYQGNFYGHSVSRISRAGQVTTVLAENLDGPVGMVFDSEGNLLICSCNDQSITKMTPDGSATTFATSADFSCPNGITMNDDGDFFVVSFSGSKIIKVTPQGDVSVFADTGGTGVGHIVYLRGVFYATSFYDNKIYRINGEGVVSEFAGSGERKVQDGPVANAMFSSPNGIAADPTGSFLYVNDYVGDESDKGIARTPFSVRRIELPRLHKVVEHKLETESIEAAEIAYRAYKDDPRNAGEDTEDEINRLGWSYMSKSNYANAISTFELNANSYPGSWRVFSSLGAAYKRAGKRDLAIGTLEKSLELNPENTKATTRLKELGAGT
jgi:sugar lactone lactonase YvrE